MVEGEREREGELGGGGGGGGESDEQREKENQIGKEKVKEEVMEERSTVQSERARRFTSFPFTSTSFRFSFSFAFSLSFARLAFSFPPVAFSRAFPLPFSFANAALSFPFPFPEEGGGEGESISSKVEAVSRLSFPPFLKKGEEIKIRGGKEKEKEKMEWSSSPTSRRILERRITENPPDSLTQYSRNIRIVLQSMCERKGKERKGHRK